MISVAAIKQVIAAGGPTVVYQPIVNMTNVRRPLGYEALSRFEGGMPPDLWFAAAWQEGLGIALEAAAIAAAIRNYTAGHGYLALNISPRALLNTDIRSFLREAEQAIQIHIVVELSEAQTIGDYELVRDAFDDLRQVGITLSIDDLGAGFSSLLHVLELCPESLKIDKRFIAPVPDDDRYNGVVAAIVALGRALGTDVIAEGVETQRQADALRILGVSRAQGFLYGHPGPLPAEVTG